MPGASTPRRVSNPPNPWSTTEVEWLGEPPAVELEVFEEEARSILSENQSPDVPFRWSLNPYRGCQHACAYCYARPSHQWLGFGAGTAMSEGVVFLAATIADEAGHILDQSKDRRVHPVEHVDALARID